MEFIPDNSVDLTVTSPPYPMIKMWDSQFVSLDAEIYNALKNNDGDAAYDLMHRQLDMVWKELCRVTREGGFVCINTGDATRKVGDSFSLYPNHSRITESFQKNGFTVLPCIIWKKRTNSPAKFLGSGMLPCGAYVTLEHEYILIFRKKRTGSPLSSDMKNRRESCYFWEERNCWFSDIWEFKGTRQRIRDKGGIRKRSGAFPFELPYRLINMFSEKGGTVLDPFSGTGTTALASVSSARNSINIEIENSFSEIIEEEVLHSKERLNRMSEERLEKHRVFMKTYSGDKKPGYMNHIHGFPVVTSQETDIKLDFLDTIYKTPISSPYSSGIDEDQVISFNADYE